MWCRAWCGGSGAVSGMLFVIYVLLCINLLYFVCRIYKHSFWEVGGHRQLGSKEQSIKCTIFNNIYGLSTLLVRL